MTLRSAGATLFLALFALREVNAQSSDTTVTKFGGYLDVYYAFDFNRPASHDRAYTTQAVRHNEFNVNLAFADATVNATRLRGRLAIQFGTSVQANYSSEPKVGNVSGPDLSRFLQEAVIGYRFAPHLWVDGGVFLSAFGSENWISRDNWTYTRSMVAENSPYYEAGVKATWVASPAFMAQVHLINGWQNISENNSGKAVGFRVDFTPSADAALAYDAFIGNEAPDSVSKEWRLWQEGIATIRPAKHLQIRGTFDYGRQRMSSSNWLAWWGYSLIGRYELNRRAAIAVRGEQYEDPHQIIVATEQRDGFRAKGWSVNTDFSPTPALLLRLEFRQLLAPNPLFTSSSAALVRRDRLLVGSASLRM